MGLNHPKTMPLSYPQRKERSVEKLSSMKLVPGAKKAGDGRSKSWLFRRSNLMTSCLRQTSSLTMVLLLVTFCYLILFCCLCLALLTTCN